MTFFLVEDILKGLSFCLLAIFLILSFISVSFSSLLSILRKKKNVSTEIALVEKDSSEKTPGKEQRSGTFPFQFYKSTRVKSSAV